MKKFDRSKGSKREQGIVTPKCKNKQLAKAYRPARPERKAGSKGPYRPARPAGPLEHPFTASQRKINTENTEKARKKMLENFKKNKE